MNRSADGMPRMLYVSGPTERYPITSLADYLRRLRNEKNLSLAQASARSRGQISKTHINRIENGTVARVSLIKLRALALGLGVPEDDLIAVAQGKLPLTDATENEAMLLSYFRQLAADRQEDVLVMLQALAKRIPGNQTSR
jgi:transcriptional regulator with XRE-family HTH domain